MATSRYETPNGTTEWKRMGDKNLSKKRNWMLLRIRGAQAAICSITPDIYPYQLCDEAIRINEVLNILRKKMEKVGRHEDWTS
jgi:hypothetical protein